MSQDSRQRLLQSAIEHFAAKGYEGATVRDICETAGLNVNAVKYYFEDKRTLHAAAVTEAHHLAMQDKPFTEIPTTGTPQEKLRQFIHQTMGIVFGGERRDQPHHLLLARELTDPSETTAQFFKTFVKPRFDFLEQTLQALLPKGFPGTERRLLVLSVIGQCMHYRVGAEVDKFMFPTGEYEKLTAERVAEHIYRVTLAAIEGYQTSSQSEIRSKPPI
ncbi:TetR/AcrR family transcriptional regulator [Aeoliella mucimassa]|uniref:Putative DNA-binding transcriptional regulator n=1 Tax=Aeoliella mucimassa TaxID=2527972 RepID=A0A518ASD8_9BACT|nr:CerR family C-terminal domain-containing protein [Aeoliella mucimassa]QDU57653.1 putative DNA-binding transcriptional regulator [Aeoliella mucimassa]